MNVQNPEVKDESKVETKTGEDTDKVLDVARQLAKGDIKEIPEDMQKEFHDRFVIEQEEIPEPIKKEEGEKSESKTTEKEVESEPEEKSSQEFLQGRKKNLDDLNTINQKIESGKKELERINNLKTQPKKKTYEDPLSEDAIKNINERLNGVEQRENKFYSDKSEEVETTTQELKQSKTLLELQVFQGDSGLKMSRPLSTIDTQYKKFFGEIGGGENVDKFFADPKFREQKESEGVSFPLSAKDFESYKTIVKVHKFKLEGKYPTISSAYADYAEQNGIVHDKIKQATINAVEKTVETMTSPDRATTLSPEDGSMSPGIENGKMSREELTSIIENLPSNPTHKEEQRYRQAHKQLFSGR